MKKTPNIYVMMSGRCGNQLFQYAYGRTMQLRTDGSLYLDFAGYDFNDETMVKQGYVNALEDFNVSDYTYVDKKNLDKSIFSKGQYEVYFFLRRLYSYLFFHNRLLASFIIYLLERIIAIPLQIIIGIYFFESANSHWLHLPPMPWHKTIILHGFFESEKYFFSHKETIMEELHPKLKDCKVIDDLLEKMKGQIVTCMSVRRGDFTSEKLKKQFMVCDDVYFEKAIEKIKEIYPHTTLLICSDDIDWCKKHLKYGETRLLFEPAGLTHAQNLFLRMHCNNFILSNSTFSWWGQSMSANTDKIIIAPKKWRNELFPPKDIYGDNWILI